LWLRRINIARVGPIWQSDREAVDGAPCDHLTSLATLTRKVAAIWRQLSPAAIAATTRFRKSRASARAIDAGLHSSQNIEPDQADLGIPIDSEKPDHALISRLRSRRMAESTTQGQPRG
jgi:hypothetical protein